MKKSMILWGDDRYNDQDESESKSESEQSNESKI